MVILGYVGTAIVFDVITGIIKAVKRGEFTSSVMREGLFHKVGEALAVCLAIFMEYYVRAYFPDITIPIVFFVSVYIIMMEIGSVIENIAVLNPDVAKPLSTIFDKLKEFNDEKK